MPITPRLPERFFGPAYDYHRDCIYQPWTPQWRVLRRWWRWWMPEPVVFRTLRYLGLWHKPEGASFRGGHWTLPWRNEESKRIRARFSFWGELTWWHK